MSNIYKNASGSYLLKQLFFETADTDRERCLYTLKSEDHEGYPSIRRLYLEENDESEFYFAKKYFDGWPHWKRLMNCSWFAEYLLELREELAVKNAADNLREMRLAASKGNISASRFLLEGSWRPKDSVGRPTKAKIKQEAEKLFMSDKDINDDLDRILASSA
jgi:hypothetical protein